MRYTGRARAARWPTAASSTASTATDFTRVISGNRSVTDMRVLGLTGGIGSGKSLVAGMFRKLGAEGIDADRLARDVVELGQPALNEIVMAFGRDVLLPDGSLNPASLAALIFADAAARPRPNALTHPPVPAPMG